MDFTIQHGRLPAVDVCTKIDSGIGGKTGCRLCGSSKQIIRIDRVAHPLGPISQCHGIVSKLGKVDYVTVCNGHSWVRPSPDVAIRGFQNCQDAVSQLHAQ